MVALFFVFTRHAAPESRRCRRGNGDPTLLFLLHPVHGGGAVVDFADFMTDTGVEQDTFGRGGFPCIDMRGDSNIAIALDWGFAGHDCVLRLPTKMAECLVGLDRKSTRLNSSH